MTVTASIGEQAWVESGQNKPVQRSVCPRVPPGSPGFPRIAVLAVKLNLTGPHPGLYLLAVRQACPALEDVNLHAHEGIRNSNT